MFHPSECDPERVGRNVNRLFSQPVWIFKRPFSRWLYCPALSFCFSPLLDLFSPDRQQNPSQRLSSYAPYSKMEARNATLASPAIPVPPSQISKAHIVWLKIIDVTSASTLDFFSQSCMIFWLGQQSASLPQHHCANNPDSKITGPCWRRDVCSRAKWAIWLERKHMLMLLTRHKSDQASEMKKKKKKPLTHQPTGSWAHLTFTEYIPQRS